MDQLYCPAAVETGGSQQGYQAEWGGGGGLEFWLWQEVRACGDHLRKQGVGWRRNDLGDDAVSDPREIADIEISPRYTERKEEATNFRKARANGRAKEKEGVLTGPGFQNLLAV